MKSGQDKNVPENKEHFKGTEASVSTVLKDRKEFTTNRAHRVSKQRQKKLESWKGLEQMGFVGCDREFGNYQ